MDRRTTPRRWVPVAVAASAVLAAGTVLAPPAGATPTDDARQRVEQAAQQLTTVEEQVHHAEADVAALQRAAAGVATQAAAAQAAVDAFAPQLRAIAQSGYTGQAQSRMAAFLTAGSADDLVQRLTTIDVIAAHTNEVIAGVAQAQAVAQQAKAAADAAAAKAADGLNQLKQQETQAKALVDQYQTELSQLSGADRTAVTTAVSGQTLGVPTPAEIAAVAPTPAIAKVIDTALAQVGAPYVWAGASPGGFDCSGLMLYAFASVGVGLPHSAEAQYGLGQHVDRAHLQPGDLVFFYSPISHVGLYIGNGMMVHARTFGMPVAVVPVDQAGYAGATRIPLP